MTQYSYKNGFVKSLILTFGVWVLETLVLFFISWGVGCFFGTENVFLAIIETILPVLLIGIALGFVILVTDGGGHLFLFCMGWLITYIALGGGASLFCALGRLPILFVVSFGGLILFFFKEAMKDTFDSIRGKSAIYVPHYYSYDD